MNGQVLPGGKGVVQLPKGVSLVFETGGSFSLHDKDQEIARGLKFSNGQMDPGTRAALTHAGYIVQSGHVQSKVIDFDPKDLFITQIQPPAEPLDNRAEVASEPLLSLFELKEKARSIVGEVKNKGGIAPAERELIASNLGRMTQKMSRRNVARSDLYTLFSIFTKLHLSAPNLISRDELATINESILKADSRLATQKEDGWEIGKSAPTVHPSPKPFDHQPKTTTPTASIPIQVSTRGLNY